jgi:hypothetical protein
LPKERVDMNVSQESMTLVDAAAGQEISRCEHASVTDPETGESFCQNCGLLLPDRPVPIGSRLVPPEEFLRRLTIKCKELDLEILLKQQRKHQLLSVAAKVQDTRYRWPGCQAPPILRSKWCPMHYHEHAKELARERQRRHRRKAAQPVKLLTCHAVTHDKPIG